MKTVAFILTILIQFLTLMSLKLLDNFSLVILIFILCLVGGFIIRMSHSKNLMLKNIGWGLLYGSLTSISLILIFIIWLSYNFPK